MSEYQLTRDVPEMRTSTGAPLPLQTPPLVFALSNRDGTTENMWGIGIVRGRALIYCGCRYATDGAMWRDRLTRSSRLGGRNGKSTVPGVLESLTPGHCLWLNWDLPASTGLVPRYTVYPAKRFWSVRFDEAERRRRGREFTEWRQPHVLIDESGDREAVVSVLPMGDDATVQAINGRTVATIGVLPLDADSKLHVVALNESSEEYEGVHRRAGALSDADMRSADWSEDDVDELFTTMGSDEVGYGLLVRQQANVTTSLD